MKCSTRPVGRPRANHIIADEGLTRDIKSRSLQTAQQSSIETTYLPIYDHHGYDELAVPGWTTGGISVFGLRTLAQPKCATLRSALKPNFGAASLMALAR